MYIYKHSHESLQGQLFSCFAINLLFVILCEKVSFLVIWSRVQTAFPVASIGNTGALDVIRDFAIQMRSILFLSPTPIVTSLQLPIKYSKKVLLLQFYLRTIIEKNDVKTGCLFIAAVKTM